MPGRANGFIVSGLARQRALLVRYWACNMTLIHDQGSVWPGFGYTPEEQEALRALARQVPRMEFMVWLALAVLGVLLGITLFGLAGFGLLEWVGHNEQGSLSDSVFYLELAVQLVVCLAVGFPAAMLCASALVGSWFKVGDQALPDPASTAHYSHKLMFQLVRAALLCSAVVLALCLWLPERVWLLTRCVMPLLGPALTVLVLSYYYVRPTPPQRASE